MKRIVLEVMTDSTGSKKGRIQIQTHKGDDFADGSDPFYASNGFKLSSESHPEAYRAGYGDPPCLCVRGDSSEDDGLIFGIPDENWLDACRVAIREYNQKFADEGAIYEVLS